jgi:hypothetical protein
MLEVDVRQVLHADRMIVVGDFVRLLTQRLESLGVRVAPGQDVVMRVSYTEREGRDVPVVQRFGDKSETVRTVTETIGHIRLRLVPAGQDPPHILETDPYALGELAQGATRTVVQESGQRSTATPGNLRIRLRQQMYAKILEWLRHVEIPHATSNSSPTAPPFAARRQVSDRAPRGLRPPALPS